MKIREILLEYNKEFLIKTFSNKFQEQKKKDHSSSVDSLEELLDKIENSTKKENKFQFIDPYIKWIIQRYVNDKLGKEEDIFSKAIPALLTYDALKRKNKLKLEHKDINKIESLSQLMNIVEEYKEEDTRSGKEKEKNLEEEFYRNGEAELIYNDSEIKVVVPKTFRASCFFGINTKWCTAASKDEEGEKVFNDYIKHSDLYIIIIKQKNKRYQFFFDSEEFTDDKNNQINPNELAKQYPVLWDIFEPIVKKAKKHRRIFVNKNLTEEDIIASVSFNPSNLKYIENPSEKVQIAAVRTDGFAIRLIKNPSEKVKEEAIKQNPNVILLLKNPSEKLQLLAVRKNGHAIRYISNPSEKIQMEAIKQTPSAIKFIDKIPLQIQLYIVKNIPEYASYIKNKYPKIVNFINLK